MPQENVDRGDEFDIPTATDPVEPAELPPTDPVDPTPAEPAEPTEKDKEKGAYIPRERFNDAVNKERARAQAAEAKLAEIEESRKVQTTNEDIANAQAWVKDAIKQKNNMLADGKLDEASELDIKILNVMDAISERRAAVKLESTRASTRADVSYDSTLTRMETQYPQINPDSDAYDEEVAEEVRALVVGYRSTQGFSPERALERAVRRVCGAAPDQAAAGLRRKTEAVGKAVAAANQQPPSTKDLGLNHDKRGGGLDTKTVMGMKYEEFSKLDEVTLARLRGDTV